MCGYVQRTRALGRSYQDYLQSLKIMELPFGRFFPGSKMSGVIFQREDAIHMIDAVWWYKLHWDSEKDKWVPLRKVASFNARNLENPLWRKPVKTHRCIIPATAIVETIEDPDDKKKKHSYLMESPEGMLLGGLFGEYKHGDETTYSCTVVTLNSHERFSKYHNKATPLFLPLDEKLLATWLDPTFTDFDYFRGLIETPQLPIAFDVTRVNNSQGLIPEGTVEILDRDN